MDRELVKYFLFILFLIYKLIYYFYYSWNSLWIELFIKDNESNDIAVLVCGIIEFIVSMLIGFFLKTKLPLLYKLSNNEYTSI